MAEAGSDKARYQRALTRGAAYNTLGLVGKGLLPVALALATWLFGAEAMAGYFLALAVAEVAGGFAISGYFDATTLYASPHVEASCDSPAESRAIHVIANGLVMSVGAALVLAIMIQLAAPPVISRFFPGYGPLLGGLPLLTWALLPRAISEVAIAGTKACMRMEYDALLKGFVHPVSLIVALAATRLFGFTVHGVFIAHAAAECVLMVASVFALNRHFPFGAVVRGLRGFVLDREMLKFAIPQGVSMTFNYYQNHIDVIMLSGFGASKLMVACYGTAARLLRELRQIRVVFSSALAPVFARQRAAGDLRDIEDTLGQLSRWTTTLVALVILPLVVLRTDLLAAIDKGYAVNTTFVVILLIVPYVNCALGLAGNSLVYARRSGLNLANNLGAAMLGTGLNLVLIPRYGLTGAAISSAVSTIAVFTAYVVEIRVLERIHWQWRTAALPHLGTAVCLGLLALFGDPGTVGTLGTRIALGVGVAVLFSVLMLVLGHPDYRALARRLVAGRGGPAAT